IFLMSFLPSARFAMMSTTAPAHASSFQAVARAIVSYAGQHGGRGPRHVAELLWAGELLPTDLVSSGSNDDAERIMLGQLSVGSLEQVPLQLRPRLIEPFVRRQPTGRKIYRFGDCTFAHADVDFSNASGAIWIVIEWPAESTPGAVRVGKDNGEVA